MINELQKVRIFLLVPFLFLFGCVTAGPPISKLVGADLVDVYGEDDVVDISQCSSKGRITAEDGAIGFGSASYEGTEIRVGQKLRNEARYFSADTVVITHTISKIPTEGAKGLVMKRYAQAFDCT